MSYILPRMSHYIVTRGSLTSCVDISATMTPSLLVTKYVREEGLLIRNLQKVLKIAFYQFFFLMAKCPFYFSVFHKF